MEKLLFTSSYYDMTKDETLVEVLAKYKNFLGEAKGYSKIKK